MKMCSKWVCLEVSWVDFECFYALLWRCTWLLSGIFLVTFDPFLTVFESFLTLSGTIWKATWLWSVLSPYPHWAVFLSFLAHFGPQKDQNCVILCWFRGDFGPFFGSTRRMLGHFLIILASFWHHFHVDLTTVWGFFFGLFNPLWALFGPFLYWDRERYFEQGT